MQNRRKFLKNSLLTVTGAGLAGRFYLPARQPSNQEEDKFIYRTLGRTGIKLPAVSMGTNNTSNPALVRTALERGVKLLATAHAYQNGNNEKMISNAIKGIPRNSYMILTNSFDINWITTQTGIMNSSFRYKKLLNRFRSSLSGLGVEYVDIFVQPFAATRESVFHEPAMKAMEAFKKEGLTRFIGISTHRREPEAVRAAVDTGIYDVVMTSYNFLKSNIDELNDALRYATNAGLGIIAMKTMAGAYWDKDRKMPINARAALKWALQNENIHTSVPDCGDFNQLDQDIEIMSDIRLTEQELKDLTPPPGAMISGLYCQQCGECLPQCPFGVDIPCIMRSYMYAYGHKNFAHAKYTLTSAGLKSNPCTECRSCNVRCKMGFDIRKKILDICGILDVPDDFIA
jgi:predicted aldo/keto reductase-like oxidoreductase